MMSHVESYHLRLKKNDKTFKELATSLKSKGCKVYSINVSENLSFITATMNDKHISLEFGEVPYRWSAYYSIELSRNKGSSKTLDVVHGTENPWTSSDLIDMMVPNPKSFNIKFHTEV